MQCIDNYKEVRSVSRSMMNKGENRERGGEGEGVIW